MLQKPTVFDTNVIEMLDWQENALFELDSGKSVSAVLADVARKCEDVARGQLYVSFMLREHGQGVWQVVSDSLPTTYRLLVEEREEHSTCMLPESIVLASEPVFIQDIAFEPVSTPWRESALNNGLRGFWSWPIRSANGQTYGAVACYLIDPLAPTDEDKNVLALLAQTVRLILHRQTAINAALEAEERRCQTLDSTTREITVEKAQAEQLAQTNEARLQVALEAGGMGIWEYNVAKDEVTWLRGTAKIYGIDADTVTMALADYLTHVHPDDRESLVATSDQVLKSANNAQIQYRIVWPDGSVRWLDSCTHVLRDDAGAPTRMVGVCADITERKRAADDLAFLANASAELAGLIDPITTLERMAYLAVPKFADWCTADLLQEDGTIQRVAVAHADPDKVELARELNRKMPEEPDAPRGVWNVIRTRQAEFVHEIKPDFIEQLTQDPERRDVIVALGLRSYIIAPLIAHGKVLGTVSFVTAESGRLYSPNDLKLAQDLANRAAIALDNANLYRAAEQSNQAKSVFLATLSHELRNPLAAMNSGLSLIELVIDDRVRVERTLAMVKRQTGQLTRLIDDLMDASRIATGKIFLQEEQLSLSEVLAEAVEAIRPEIDAKNQELSVHVPSHSTVVFGDSARLVQVFSNLLTNASRYTSPGGRIDVCLEEVSTEYLVSIRDTGVGIEKEMLPRIFKLFSQVLHPLQRTNAGLGIGLSLVDGLVKLHGGRVEAFSEGLGLGSEFVVHLPRALSAEEEKRVTGDIAQSLDASQNIRRKILIVDDNEDAAITLRDILQMLNQEVVLAHDGYSGVKAAAEARPDVILLDIGLPGIDGYEVAKRIRAYFGTNCPCLVALTGWGLSSDKQKAFEAGFDSHLVKPVKIDDLLKIVQNCHA